MFDHIYKKENLIEWLKTKDPLEEYNYNSCKECLLAQYLRANIPDFVSIGVDWWNKKGEIFVIPNFRELNKIAFAGAWTFGAALERANA